MLYVLFIDSRELDKGSIVSCHCCDEDACYIDLLDTE
jgi:hypothetical protein